MICTKCKIDKPESEYGTYFHRPQNKIRTRKYCLTCYNKQQREVKMRIKQSKLIKCWACNEELDPKFFYDYNRARCRRCLDKASRLAKLKKVGGSTMIPNKPNIYTDEFQKEQVFEFLQLIGYLYDEEKGVWLKPGVKEIVNNKVEFKKLKTNYVNIKNGKGHIIPKEIKKQIIESYNRGNKMMFIANLFNVSYSAIYKIVKNYERGRV